MLNCSGSQYIELPPVIPNYTDWMLFENTNLTKICGVYPYITISSNVTYISLKHSQIQTICPETVDRIGKNSSVKWLDLSYNNMSKLPHGLSSAKNIEKLWLEGNPLFCDCEMTWMIDWLSNSGKEIVQNLDTITCAYGKEIGKPIYLLKPYDMGCYHSQTAMFIVICTVAMMIVIMVFVLGLIVHYVDIRLVVYKKFGVLIGNPDVNEKIDEMEFDAFLSYW